MSDEEILKCVSIEGSYHHSVTKSVFLDFFVRPRLSVIHPIVGPPQTKTRNKKKIVAEASFHGIFWQKLSKT